VEFWFLKPSFFSDNLNQKLFPSLQASTVILPLISQTIWFFEPISIPLEVKKTPNSTVRLRKKKQIGRGRVAGESLISILGPNSPFI